MTVSSDSGNKLQAERIQDQIQRFMLRANKNSKAKQLPLVLEAIDKLSDEDVLLVPTHEELQQIDRHLFVRKVNEVDVSNEAGIDIESLLGGEHFQLQGRDSRRFFNGGFSSTLQHMNLFAVMAQLQNREKLTEYM